MMFPLSTLFAAALALAPADRLRMADKMYAKGLYAEAAKEYAALKSEKTVDAAEIEFRMAECSQSLGKGEEALPIYERLIRKDIPKPMRAVALYRVASARNDAAMLLESEKTDPKGSCAVLAQLKRALILAKSDSKADRREATGLFLELSMSQRKSVAEEATYVAALLAYGDRRWKEAAILFGRLVKEHPDGKRAAEARVPFAWSAFLSGRYSDCLEACGDSTADDLAYLRGAALMATDRREQGLAEFAKYVEAHPQGKHRAAAELPVQRARFDAAVKGGDWAAAVQAAKQAAALSDKPADALRLAWAHERAGAADEARAEYARIAKRWPDDPSTGEALFANALADLRRENWAAGELALDETLKRFPNLPRRNEALYWRGIAAARLGHGEEGVARLKEALALGLSLDQAREANLIIADSDAQAGRTDAAAKRYVDLLSKGASERMSAVHLAAVVKLLAGCGEWQAALTGARALAVRSGDPSFVQIAAAYEGQSLEGLARYDEAMAAYRRAFSVKADTAEGAAAALALGLLESRKGEYDAAERTLADAVSRNSGPDGMKARAKAYRALADVCRAKGEALKAKGYETVLKELFGDEE